MQTKKHLPRRGSLSMACCLQARAIANRSAIRSNYVVVEFDSDALSRMTYAHRPGRERVRITLYRLLIEIYTFRKMRGKRERGLCSLTLLRKKGVEKNRRIRRRAKRRKRLKFLPAWRVLSTAWHSSEVLFKLCVHQLKSFC